MSKNSRMTFLVLFFFLNSPNQKKRKPCREGGLPNDHFGGRCPPQRLVIVYICIYTSVFMLSSRPPYLKTVFFFFLAILYQTLSLSLLFLTLSNQEKRKITSNSYIISKYIRHTLFSIYITTTS